MSSTPNTPRELLWYHQLQRENRHLLSLIKKQALDIEKLTTASTSIAQERLRIQNLVSSLEAKAAATTERRREEFEREKEILKRVGRLEEGVERLKREESQAVVGGGGGSQWVGLEQRFDELEERMGRVEDGDMEQLRLRIDALGKAIEVILKGSAAVVEPSIDLETGDEQISAALETGDEQAPAAHAEVDNSMPEVPAEEQLGIQAAHDVESGAKAIEEQMPMELPRKPVKQKRRIGGLNMPFRPTPSDLGM
ncbi:hypothetical protein E4T43_02939 [Aureobasidium subglaciale]|nr:hypothetical protein E4T43_02939 [Aureobasidium subglaciale]